MSIPKTSSVQSHQPEVQASVYPLSYSDFSSRPTINNAHRSRLIDFLQSHRRQLQRRHNDLWSQQLRSRFFNKQAGETFQTSRMPEDEYGIHTTKATDANLSVDTMTSGANSSAGAHSTDKDSESLSQTSQATKDENGTHTTKTLESRGAEGKKDSRTSEGSAVQEHEEAGNDEGVFAKAGNASAAVGGAVAGVRGGKAVVSAE
ncbi:hypothetical protein BU25DRAFT_447508 [Macroventuria anomochaeta]|uniref:Uncharacterized protein n=1 Tax=Macroventuria anomochaeta TaxID=301207 RepID=A0ACB6S4N3_9PLEO|nr:uncharacterized protein BU25DRAFT_447508 [Macroventuria anomochaeta]KAF2628998.1 hypothetical protein BU25DRAFT_447508 [Macroventuria anomochaeta]